MTPKTEDPALLAAMMQAEELGFRMEIINGLGVWEFAPAIDHARAEKRIVASIRRAPHSDGDCGCHWYQDILIRFPDGSIRRPDISIFCVDPPSSRQALEVIPEATIEIVSEGSERKDLDLSPDFYLRHGIKDAVVLDPASGNVWHYRNDRPPVRGVSPVEIAFECGCVATV